MGKVIATCFGWEQSNKYHMLPILYERRINQTVDDKQNGHRWHGWVTGNMLAGDMDGWQATLLQVTWMGDNYVWGWWQLMRALLCFLGGEWLDLHLYSFLCDAEGSMWTMVASSCRAQRRAVYWSHFNCSPILISVKWFTACSDERGYMLQGVSLLLMTSL